MKIQEIMDNIDSCRINEWQYYIDKEQDSSAKSSFQRLLNNLIALNKKNKELCDIIIQLDKNLQQNEINSVLNKNYKKLQKKYTQTQEELNEIKTILYKILNK